MTLPCIKYEAYTLKNTYLTIARNACTIVVTVVTFQIIRYTKKENMLQSMGENNYEPDNRYINI